MIKDLIDWLKRKFKRNDDKISAWNNEVNME